LSNGKESLASDLIIIEDIAAEMPEYLRSSLLFWPRVSNKLVQPSIGGFWVRQHRLQRLKEKLLTASEQQRLARAIQSFDNTCMDQRWSFHQKARQEFEARIRQWAEILTELLEDEPPSMNYYRSDVEVRAIVEAIKSHQDIVPIEAEKSTLERIRELDHHLQENWVIGPFIWPAGWEAAYPRQQYWWLYGSVKGTAN